MKAGLLLLSSAAVLMAAATSRADPLISNDGLINLGTNLRPMNLKALPNPLYQKSENWGQTTIALDHIHWRRLRPEVIKGPKNDGTWRKTRVTAIDPEKNFELRLSDWQTLASDRFTFKAYVALMVNAAFEEEIWEKGVRLLRITPEARVRVKANIEVETTMKLVSNPNSFIPDTVFRLRATKADVSYDNLVFEHFAGMGGTGARWTGEAVRGILKKWKPSIERDLLTRADTAVIKAADTRDVHVSLSKLLKIESGK